MKKYFSVLDHEKVLESVALISATNAMVLGKKSGVV